MKRLGWAAVFLAAAVARAEEPRPAAAAELVSYLKAWARAREPWERDRVSLQRTGAAVGDVLKSLCREHGLELGITPDAAKAGSELIDLDFTDSAPLDILEFLAEFQHLPLVLDREGRLWLATPAEEAALSAPGYAEARKLPSVPGQLRRDATPIEEPEEQRLLKERLEQMDSTLVVRDTPLPQAIRRLAEQTNLEIELYDLVAQDGSRLDERKVTIELRDRPVPEILDALCAGNGMGWFVMWREIRLARAESAAAGRQRWADWEAERRERVAAENAVFERPVKLHGEGLTAARIAALLEEELGIPCRLDVEAWELDRTWTIPEGPRTVGELVKLISGGDAICAGYREGIVWFLRGNGE